MQETRRLGFNPWIRKISLEEEMATSSSILAWKIPWTEEPGGPQSMGSQRGKPDWAHVHTHIECYVPHLYLVSWNVKWNDVNSDVMEVLWGLKEEACVEACHILGCVGQTLTDNRSFLAWSLEVQSLKNLISKTALPVGRVNYHRQCSKRQKSQSWVISRRS